MNKKTSSTTTKSRQSTAKSSAKPAMDSSASQAKEAMDKFKFEVANEIGVPLKKGYNGDLTSAQNGYVGGYMVKKMIEAQERQMASGTSKMK